MSANAIISQKPARALTEDDLYFFREGTHARLGDVLGAQWLGPAGGARFTVWAPNASRVSVIGDWNGWDADAAPLVPRADGSGLWEGTAPDARPGAVYKYRVVGPGGRWAADKADPFGFASELPPATGSRLCALDFDWRDADWVASRAARNAADAPMSIYELHAGSWRRPGGVIPNWRELADALVPYIVELGFTHVELMPVAEHPFYGSWGYQTTGYFAPSARYGTPQDLMHFVDRLHGAGIGVILDWVPSHFPTDEHGLQYFDGTHLYEHADPRQGFHPEWNSSIFNYGRNEVRAFLVSSALFWLEKYHIDGLRVDGVASMLYLDYARRDGEWIANRHGGRENLEAVSFLQLLNETVHRECPAAVTIAEESTAWPGVSRPAATGGLGFDMKWNMGWMHDTLAYFARDPLYRKFHQGQLTFSLVYAFHENFVLPLSHDEVVYGKGSLLGKMPGDDWQQFANLRALYGYFWTHPGKKLLFMGGEIAQRREWTHEGELDGWLDEAPAHAGVTRLVADLNRLYRAEPSLHALDFDAAGFEWVDTSDAEASVVSFLRKSPAGRPLLVVCNLTPLPRHGYAIGVPAAGPWRELLNTDAAVYGGSGVGNFGAAPAVAQAWHGQPCSVRLTLPPLATLVLAADPPPAPQTPATAV